MCNNIHVKHFCIPLEDKTYWSIIRVATLTVQALSLNVEHCEANVGKQYTVALEFYIAKALPLKNQITAHKL